jgi:hypothetical protein
VPLHLRATAAGTYQLAVETLASLPAGYQAYLRDAVTGRYTDLAAVPGTAVALAANASTNRYAVLFTTQPRVLAVAPAALAALVSLYPNPAHGSTTLVLPQALGYGRAAGVRVLNALGQELPGPAVSQTKDGLEISLAGLAPGVYTVQVATPAGTLSRRLVVR